MNELKTILGTEIPTKTRGILYLCYMDYKTHKLNVLNEILFDNSFYALNAYSNIPNPESQLVMGKTFDDLIKENEKLKQKINNPDWIKQLEECL